MRSTLRRNAMTTPASVHCVSGQHVFGDLSCTGFRRKIWHPRHHCLVTIHSSRIGSYAPPGTSGSRAPPGSSGSRAPPGTSGSGVPPAPPGSSGSGFSGLTGSISRQWHRINIVSAPSRFHVDVVHVVFFVSNCATSVLRISQLLLDPSIHFLCNIRTFMEHVTFVTVQHSDSTHRRVFSNRQQWFAHRCLNTSNP